MRTVPLHAYNDLVARVCATEEVIFELTGALAHIVSLCEGALESPGSLVALVREIHFMRDLAIQALGRGEDDDWLSLETVPGVDQCVVDAADEACVWGRA